MWIWLSARPMREAWIRRPAGPPVEMRSAIIQCSLELFRLKNVRLEKTHAFIDGKLGQYTVHLGSGVVHQMGNAMVFVVPVHSQHRGRIFLPFVDDDPKTAEILSKILLFAEDDRIKDPGILSPDPLTGRKLLAVLFVFFLEILPPLFTVGAFL